MIKYTVISHTTREGLVNRVNNAISQGWMPQGGLSYTMVALDDLIMMYSQAMVKGNE